MHQYEAHYISEDQLCKLVKAFHANHESDFSAQAPATMSVDGVTYFRTKVVQSHVQHPLDAYHGPSTFNGLSRWSNDTNTPRGIL